MTAYPTCRCPGRAGCTHPPRCCRQLVAQTPWTADHCEPCGSRFGQIIAASINTMRNRTPQSDLAVYERRKPVSRRTQLEDYLSASVWVDPARRSGEACIGGTRIPATLIAGLANDGMTAAQIRSMYPDVTAEGVKAAVYFASHYQQQTWDEHCTEALATFRDDHTDMERQPS